MAVPYFCVKSINPVEFGDKTEEKGPESEAEKKENDERKKKQ